MSREDRVIEILKQSPGLSAYDIEQRLIADYRFKWVGYVCEFGRVHRTLMQLASRLIITSRPVPGPYPRKYIYFVEPV